MITETNWVRLYNAIYFKIPNAVTNEALPSLINIGTHEIFGVLEVNGDATEASVSDKLTPAWAKITKY